MSRMQSDRRATAPEVHPAGDLMADYAAGQLHPFRRWLVDAHLEYCPACRALAASGAQIGGAWLQGLVPARPEAEKNRSSPPELAELYSALEARLLVEESMARQPAWPEMPLPESVRREIEDAASSTEWVRLGESSSRVVRVALDPRDELEFYLVRTPAGGSFPPHRHPGGEDLLVLSGSLSDEFGSLRAGDLWHYPAGSAHAPVIGDESECFALACVRGGLDFET